MRRITASADAARVVGGVGGRHVGLPLHGAGAVIAWRHRRAVVGAHPRVRPQRNPTLSEVVQWFKTMTTNAYIQGVRDQAWPPFDRRLWQRNFYEHVVRGEGDLERIRRYIADNPAQWHLDQLRPEGMAGSEYR
jgi:hypothetical protein